MTAEIDAWFAERTARHEFSGVALVVRDGETLFSFAGGLAQRGHGVPNAMSTRFGVASIGKMVTATAALRLIDRGLMRLDQPVLDLLPEEHRIVALTPSVTLGHLLSHSSGLPDYFDDGDPTWDSWLASWDRIPTYRVRRPADILPLFRDRPAVAQPGERQHYNNAAFILVGLAIEAVTGLPYADAVTAEVLRPTAMIDSSFEALDDDPRDLATGYVTSDEPADRWRTNIFAVTAAPMPDGGMISTASDLVRLVGALVEGDLLAEDTALAMRTPQGPPTTESQQYGYGLILGVENGRVRTVGHGGGDPGVSTLVTHDLPARTTVVTLCNQDRGSFAASKRLAEEFGVGEPRG